MHSHVEILIPPTRKDDIEAAIEEVMAPFNESAEDVSSAYSGAFWDYYTIGGRFSGAKVEAALDPKQLADFRAELERRKVTVSNIQFGKPALSPSNQTHDIDALYREWFPGGGTICPFFAHYDDRKGINPADICSVRDVPEQLKCDRLLIAGPHWDNANRLEAKRMLACKFWNGVNFQPTDWNGQVRGTLTTMLNESTPLFSADWLLVTVDSHR